MNAWLEAHNILAVRLDNAGDVVMLGPALRAIKQTSPEARLTLLASPAGSLAAPLLPWIDDVIVWRSIWQDVGGHMPFDPTARAGLIRTLAERQFDAALIFTSFSQTPQVPGYVCYLAGIPLRAGESKEFGGSALIDRAARRAGRLHQAERNLRLIESSRLHGTRSSAGIAISATIARRRSVLLADVDIDPQKPFVLIHPGASAEARRYPPQRMGEVAHLLRRDGWQVLLTGVEREARDSRRGAIAGARRALPDRPDDAGAVCGAGGASVGRHLWQHAAVAFGGRGRHAARRPLFRYRL